MADVNLMAAKFEATLQQRGLKYERREGFERPAFVLNFGGGDFQYSHVAIHVIFDDNGESAQFITSPIVSVSAEKTASLLLACNKANCRFRWVKFYLDEDNDLVANADVLIDEYTVGEECAGIVSRIASIIDDAYGDFMRAMWA